MSICGSADMLVAPTQHVSVATPFSLLEVMMAINADKPHLWKTDVERSIDFYNDWFLRFAPDTFRSQRAETTARVADALELTDYLRDVTPQTLRDNPGILPILRMICAPPLARERLVGMAHLNKNLVSSMEGKPETPPRMPPQMPVPEQLEQLQRICDTVTELADRDLFNWLESGEPPTDEQVTRAAMVVADRLCGAAADPIIRNAQERRQLETIEAWLTSHGYTRVAPGSVEEARLLPPGRFAIRMNVRIHGGQETVNIPSDCVIQPRAASPGDFPILIEAKSAGDVTNTNKRRKEEAQKYHQLTSEFGPSIKYVLFLCGYFEPGYLGYEAAEGLDWVWEHRLTDLDLLLGERGKRERQIADELATYETSVGAKEQQRFTRQKEIDSRRTPLHRNQMGQFSTPFLLAGDIVDYSLSVFEDTGAGGIYFLEPAVGTGVFFSALSPHAFRTELHLATGVELDAEYAKVAADLWSEPPFEIENSDFVTFSSLFERQKTYNLLCTNPPYVRHHHLPARRKLDLQQRVMHELRLRPSGLSGLYVYFVLLADRLLCLGAVASWLIPSEFLSVNYGQVLREYLLQRVTLKRIHQFDPTDVQFEDALVSSCVVTYVKQEPSQPYEFEFTHGGTLTQPRQVRILSSDRLSPHRKWSLNGIHSELNSGVDSLRLGDLFEVRRGIATGSNDFFIVDSDVIEEYRIPSRFLKPILPSPRYIKDRVIQADDQGFPVVSGARYLLDCSLPPDQVRKQFPDLWRYFMLGESKGIPNGYLCANRKIWYLQEQRDAALYMATYMSRGRSNTGNPFRFFLNLSEAIGTNVFLLLYPKPTLKAALEDRQDRMLELLDLLNGLAREHVLGEGRTYGGGLHKLEPNELANLRLDRLPDWLQPQAQLRLALA